jgi:glutamine synthetase
MTVKEALDLAKKNKAVAADLRFCDFLGTWQHCTFPISEIDEGVFEDGLGFDGSSIRGWQPIQESDMIMIPDPATAFMDPRSRRSPTPGIRGTSPRRPRRT